MRTAGKGLLACGLVLAFGCSPPPSGAPKAGGAVEAVLPSSSSTAAPSGAAPEGPRAPPAETASDADAGAAADPERSNVEKRGPPDLKLIENEVADALKRASGCDVEPRWKGWTIPLKITVSNDGRFDIDVGFVTISRPDDDFETLLARPRTPCISAHFEMITVPPFDGERVVLERKLKIR